MGELGKDELKLHRDLYKDVIDNGVDMLYTVGELSSSIVDAMPKGVVEAKSFKGDDGKEQLLAFVTKKLKKGDTVLVKASHFMDFPKIVEGLKEALRK